VRWIVFDYGEVIGRRPLGFAGLAAMLDAPPEPFEAAYWAFRDAYDRGLPDLEYWRAIGSRIGADVDAARAAALTDADIEGWLDADPAALALLDELDDAEVGLALLSNAASSHGQAFRQQPWAEHFQHLMISAELGTAKPDAEVWRLLVQRLEIAPVDCLFLDDKQVNIDGARAAGLQAHRWSGATAARRHIARFGLPLR
jgi:putative hydrolase of the HAD superfamily